VGSIPTATPVTGSRVIKLSNGEITFRHHPNDNSQAMDLEEKLDKFLEKDPSIFLERWGRYLDEETLGYFDIYQKDYEVQFYLGKFKNQTNEKQKMTTIKNRRYMYLQKLISEGEYFSEDEMKNRDPILYDYYIGQYLTPEEKLKPPSADTTLSQLLLGHMDSTRHAERLQENSKLIEESSNYDELDEDDAAMEPKKEKEQPFTMSTEQIQMQKMAVPAKHQRWGGFSEPGLAKLTTPALSSNQNPLPAASDENLMKNAEKMMKSAPKPEKWGGVSMEEKQILREEFVQVMHHRFLEGKDTEFDYSMVDENEDYDDWKQSIIDAEEASN